MTYNITNTKKEISKIFIGFALEMHLYLYALYFFSIYSFTDEGSDGIKKCDSNLTSPFEILSTRLVIAVSSQKGSK